MRIIIGGFALFVFPGIASAEETGWVASFVYKMTPTNYHGWIGEKFQFITDHAVDIVVGLTLIMIADMVREEYQKKKRRKIPSQQFNPEPTPFVTPAAPTPEPRPAATPASKTYDI